MKTIYTTSAKASAGRNGQVKSDDGLLDVSLSYPKALGGSGEATNPEQLFAAGYSACFSNAVLHIAGLQKLGLREAPTEAKVRLLAKESGAFALAVDLSVELAMDDQAAIELVKSAHQVCPYSNAVRGNVEVSLTVNGISLD
ncbi:organic hydroperoxide resistance protein [Photobacterium halotolerans]|uniref:Ohr family peroxiredoxin n=1 Tax=Photobacterium halotolerans TaxID=265726 RepID=A0A7X4WE50_9GAMM|nr:organic hydroperoxide resistance protein [Photobacterium halotolerans]NAW67089.1 Ohr family peroxiredoxin [Photobacterium halotolerans]NAW86377.1 Ohr family peroxiredoxin [Photobacterium halotolerans]NAX46527.1 Ohr family peroxiredoxin [Photobacterium halotolerans]